MRAGKLGWGVALIATAGCVDEAMPEADEGRALFVANCAACHGAAGLGDGPAAAGLDPKPVDLTRLASGDEGFDRVRILSAIDGYTRARTGPHVMPEFGATLRGPTVPLLVDGSMSPVPRPLAALVLYLESIQQP